MNNSKYSKEDAQNTLDRIQGLISNCDTKASIILGVVSVVISAFFSELIITKTYSYLCKNITTLKCIIFLVFTIFIFCVFLFGIYKLISVLIANHDVSGNDSKIYFTDIANNDNVKVYKKKVLTQSENEQLDDIINQIYINSKICDKKYRNYNKGVKSVSIAIALLICDIVVFMILR